MSLRRQLIRLAFSRPEIRKDLLPLLRSAAGPQSPPRLENDDLQAALKQAEIRAEFVREAPDGHYFVDIKHQFHVVFSLEVRGAGKTIKWSLEFKNDYYQILLGKPSKPTVSGAFQSKRTSQQNAKEIATQVQGALAEILASVPPETPKDKIIPAIQGLLEDVRYHPGNHAIYGEYYEPYFRKLEETESRPDTTDQAAGFRRERRDQKVIEPVRKQLLQTLKPFMESIKEVEIYHTEKGMVDVEIHLK